VKVSDLRDALTQYDPFADVVIVGEDTYTYFNFIIEERYNRPVEPILYNNGGIAVLCATDNALKRRSWPRYSEDQDR
jgi:hypothetical protein